ncbi:MAG: hypothetical protein J5725_07240 [Bacteroidales bacterium]|nr:hypothetical protein [Bacteroidales bacterium]
MLSFRKNLDGFVRNWCQHPNQLCNDISKVHHPRRWVLKEVKLSDNLSGDGADTLTTRYGYQYGYYDHAERRFLGFAKVSTD